MIPVITRVVNRLSLSDDVDIQADWVEMVIVNGCPYTSCALFVKGTMQRQGMSEIGTYILSVGFTPAPVRDTRSSVRQQVGQIHTCTSCAGTESVKLRIHPLQDQLIHQQLNQLAGWA